MMMKLTSVLAAGWFAGAAARIGGGAAQAQRALNDYSCIEKAFCCL
jgi:hypothetical protein